MVNCISENHDQLHWLSGNESKSTDGKLAFSKIWTTQSKSSTQIFSLYLLTIHNMIQNDGGNTSNNSELASSLEKYIPYSERFSVKNERFWAFFNYLERVIWIDLEKCSIEYAGQEQDEVMIYLQNWKWLSLNQWWVIFADIWNWGVPQSVFFAMEAPSFFHTYQSIIPSIKHNFIQ